MDRTIDIKRRAQRSVQSGDLDGALAAYEQLIGADPSDPYNFILLADLLYKKGDQENAAKRYLSAAECYEKSGLYKNAIAVGKKMLRLTFSPVVVLEQLARLHVLDDLPTEGTLYYTQLAEHLMRDHKATEAVAALHKALECSPERIEILEKLAEIHTLADDARAAATALVDAAHRYRQAGRTADAARCDARAETIHPGARDAFEAQRQTSEPAPGAATEVPAGRGWPGRRLEGGNHPENAPEPGTRTLMTDGVPGESLQVEAPPRFVPPVEAPGMDAALEDQKGAASEAATQTPAVEAPAEPPPPTDIKGVEKMLGLAQSEFRSGNRERAAAILARAAQAYESFDRLDNAASIYRSLCSGPHATTEMLEMWLRNCRRRDDRREAGQVACDLGDRAIQNDDLDLAQEWFERALSFDQNNLVARRRLDRLRPRAAAQQAEQTPVAAAPAPAQEPSAPEAAVEDPEDGKIHIALDRGKAVNFDFAATLDEFQRGVESQISGDSRAHYDLAVAYREMGLTSQAIDAFRMAAKDPNFTVRSAEMIGHCLLAEGRLEEAACELNEVLANSGLDEASSVGIRFQLGLALEAGGRTQEALAEFERVFNAQPNYPDVTQKIRALRNSLEAA